MLLTLHISSYLNCGLTGTDSLQWLYILQIKVTFKSHWSI